MNTEELITRIFDKRSHLKELGFAEAEIFKIIFDADSFNNSLLEEDLFDLLIEYYKINVP